MKARAESYAFRAESAILFRPFGLQSGGMAGKGEQTRERILAAAEPLVLESGFAGTSLDDILQATSLTKGAFFHHFKDKNDLARALVERYVSNDLALFERFAAEADAAADEPLEQAYAFLRAFDKAHRAGRCLPRVWPRFCRPAEAL